MSNHQLIRDNIIKGDILLSCHKTHPISQVIAGVTKSNWSHAFLYIGDDKFIHSFFNGVEIKPLDFYLNDEYRVGLFRHKPPLGEGVADKVIKAARKMLGIHYSFLQLFWQLILRICGKNEDPDWSLDVSPGMICTELIAKAYETVGIRFKDLPPHQMEPVDFDDSPITVRIA